VKNTILKYFPRKMSSGYLICLLGEMKVYTFAGELKPEGLKKYVWSN
jgi:hypothetical protein